MASILRSIVAGPRLRNPEAGLDLCYVTDNIIVTSGPSSTYPQRAYRNPTDALVKFLDEKHGEKWAIWEFRAEGTGYPDTEVHGRIRHFPFPDHHPPPFALIPNIMASMRNWLKDPDTKKDGAVVVVHCKAGKGRSGTVACSYLISEERWSKDDALARFTARRMRAGFGAGVSIPSQLRWVGYVEQWTKTGKLYLERQIEILEVHVWGLRDGVKVAVEGFVDEGRTIKNFHVFKKHERLVVDGTAQNNSIFADLAGLNNTSGTTKARSKTVATSKFDTKESSTLIDATQIPSSASQTDPSGHEVGGGAVIFRPSSRIVLPTSDICIDFERRNRATYGWTMVTAVAHVWFNAYFEGLGLEQHAKPSSNGIFEIEWDAMDGIKGSSRKGTRALDRLAVVWKALDEDKQALPQIITEPAMGEPVKETKAADWRKGDTGSQNGKDLGLRVESPGPGSTNMSRANSIKSSKSGLGQVTNEDDDADSVAGVKCQGPDGESHIPEYQAHTKTGIPQSTSQKKMDGMTQEFQHVRTEDPPGDIVEEAKEEESKETKIGSFSKDKI
ncbi:Telomerase protein component 1 [Xylographa bjoerkii]|nr:Telomerase protein component 1 [Xylographa bjoerkii]